MDSGRGVVDLGEVDVVIPDSSVEKGDEIVLMGVTYGTRWSAHRVENISTMLGMLYCPFIANFINIRKAEALCSGNEFLTAFVKVRVTAVETRDMVRLIVEDCVEDEEESCPGSDVQNGKERGVVCMKDRGFLQIFGTTKKGFLRMERDQVRTAVEAIREVVWRIIVCCGVEDVPVLTACVRGS